MSATVSSFGDQARKKKAARLDGAFRDQLFHCPDCNGVHFMTKVTIQKQRGNGEPGDVVGYSIPLRCTSCGWGSE